MKNKKKNKIIPLLKQAYAAELETGQYYLANSVWLDGLRAREVAEALAADVTEDLAVQLLADEEGHRTLFEGFLKSVKTKKST